MTSPPLCQSRPDPSSQRFLQVIAERPLKLWVTTEDTQAYHVDFHRFVCLTIGPLNLTWEQWRRVQIHPTGDALVWPYGLTYSLEDFLHEEYIGSRHALVRVTRLASLQAFYRPLLSHLPPDSPRQCDLQAEVLRRYDLDVAALLGLSQNYAAPPILLYRRLLDLLLALEHAYSMSEDSVRDLLNWQWHRQHRRTTAPRPTPRASIEAGDLAQVEATLYPHLPRGWS